MALGELAWLHQLPLEIILVVTFTQEASHLASSPSSPLNSLKWEAFIEGRTAEEKYEKDRYAAKWTLFNDLELICGAYHRIHQLTYVDVLLAALKALFIKLFLPTFFASLLAIKSSKLVSAAAHDSPKAWNFAKAFEGWDSPATIS
ncbi:signal recognition particle, alpha subunit, N-terminal-domain-containing protein [Suillus lakei]|nr:signal recognition particle, alpha subunit, N-terminal-domain-containing protein [Suillus lakei]